MPTAAGRQERGDKARRLGGGDSGREQTVREKNSTELKEEAHEQALGERVPGQQEWGEAESDQNMNLEAPGE